MRRLILCAIGITVLLMTGCIQKGPYYIYGDYIEDLQEEAMPEEGEIPVEETPVETEL